jgi:hypothetical protein
MKLVVLSLFSALAACGSSADPPPAPAPAPAPAAAAPAAPAPAPAPGVSARTTDSATRSEVGEVNPRLLRRFKPVRAEIDVANEPPA